jgi:hypothetical protein
MKLNIPHKSFWLEVVLLVHSPQNCSFYIRSHLVGSFAQYLDGNVAFGLGKSVEASPDCYL